MTALVDTSFLFALINRNDKSHPECAGIVRAVRLQPIVPVTVLPEITYLLDTRLGYSVMRQFVEQITGDDWILESILRDDLRRAGQLLVQYSDSRLDFVDATIVAAAERLNVKRILTLDRRHFRLIRPRHCGTFEILP